MPCGARMVGVQAGRNHSATAMISDAQGYYQYGYWWYLLFPCLALIITTLAFNILGDSVRDALDPRGGPYV